MTDHGFQALVIRDVDGKRKVGFEALTRDDLPDNDVLVEISHSSLNYKDGLAIAGSIPIARRLPMVGGIDLAGTVVESKVPQWRPGDQVLVNGWGLSETEWGGYSRFQSIKAGHLTRLPKGFSAAEAMAIGTAGYTAALCAIALEDWGHITPGEGEVLVTGAAGGVGTVAISLLAKRGYKVVASTGRASQHEFLQSLGASGFISRQELNEAGRPLQAERWSGAVDAVGSHTLANVLAQTKYGGAVAACGLAQGMDLPVTVMPFILRSVALLGVDSVMAPQEKRARAWDYLDKHLDRATLHALTTTAKLSEVPKLAEAILKGETRGRYVIEIA
ncbi:MDR family oxidoreductase [Paracoccus aminophilus]|uniref:Putative quinone oxidoreductase n=1 Tax=Paracoccus aminophilus JCM 7686 TaxID=1367847 RepID=S5XUD7_PARAH|nr:MDR family oxidoreductase [Paracoccus aminophilus]AGT08822.1 putative quinone oxidoreductase [Paracoccus aminophilus JCM 7686]